MFKIVFKEFNLYFMRLRALELGKGQINVRTRVETVSEHFTRLSIESTLQSNQSSHILRNSYKVPNLGIVVMLMVKNATVT